MPPCSTSGITETVEVLDSRLKRELITKEQLEAAARRQGIESLDKVDTCRLETGGALTFVARAPTADEERHDVLVTEIGELDTAGKYIYFSYTPHFHTLVYLGLHCFLFMCLFV